MPGTLRGTSALFFGYIGFDEVCCLAGRAEKPEQNMPRALVGTLVAVGLISMLAQFALAVMAPAEMAKQWPSAFEAHGWVWAKIIISVSEAILLPLVVLLSFLPQPELLGAMAKDSLLPPLFKRVNSKGTFVWASNISGFMMTVIAACVPFSVLWNMISLAVLLSFNLANTSLIMLRYGNGGEVRSPTAARLVGILWGSSIILGYVFWLGVADPTLNGRTCSRSSLVVSAAAASGVVITMMRIYRLPQIENADDEKGPDIASAVFRVPAVPFVPGCALVCNFMLMATMPWQDHLYLGLSIVLFLGMYISCRALLHRPTSPVQPTAPDYEMADQSAGAAKGNVKATSRTAVEA